MHTVLRRLTGEFRVALDYEAMLEVQYRKVIGGGATVIDAGAHAGRHTRIFSELCGPSGQVIAVEPLPAQAQALRGLGLSNVSVIEAAISDRAGMASFVHAQGTPEESGLKARVFNFPEWAEPCEIEVELRTLDQIAGPMRRCDYIKMDLEGGELNALIGGTETLTRLRPLVSVEHGVAGYAAYGHGPDDIRAFGERHG